MCIHGCIFSLASVFVFSSPVLRVPPTLHCLLIWLHAGLHLVLKEIAVTCRWLWNPSTVPCTADLTCLRYQHLFLSKQRFYDVSMCIRVREIAGSNKYFSDVHGRRLKKKKKKHQLPRVHLRSMKSVLCPDDVWVTTTITKWNLNYKVQC